MESLPDTADLPPPRRVDLRSPSNVARTRRAALTVRTLRRRLGPLAVRKALRFDVDAREVAGGLRAAAADLGATWVKFGQIVASAPGLFGEAVSDEFRVLLDEGPPVGVDRVRAVIERETGTSLDERFAEIDPEPLGCASMAVVHRAVLRDGTPVAVKVLRPGIRGKVATDLHMMRLLLPPIIGRASGATPEMLGTMLDGLTEQLSEELDLRNEAAVMELFRALLDHVDLPGVVIPRTYPELSGSRVLTMELLDGVPIDDFASVEEMGVDPAPVVAEVVKSFFLTTLGYGIFHGDVHAGNLLLLRDGGVGVLDWGIVGRLRPENRRAFRTTIRAALGDEAAWRTVIGDLLEVWGPVLRDRSGMDDAAIAAMVRAMLEQVFTRPFGEISLATLILGPDAGAAGFRPPPRRSGGNAAPSVDPDLFDRGMVLLGKQLLYFERYGKLYLSDVPLLDDRAFFEQVLAATPD